MHFITVWILHSHRTRYAPLCTEEGSCTRTTLTPASRTNGVILTEKALYFPGFVSPLLAVLGLGTLFQGLITSTFALCSVGDNLSESGLVLHQITSPVLRVTYISQFIELNLVNYSFRSQLQFLKTEKAREPTARLCVLQHLYEGWSTTVVILQWKPSMLLTTLLFYLISSTTITI